MVDKKYDVVGVGNAVVDALSHCDEAFIREHQMQKGAMTLIDEERSEALYKEMGPATECSGGSVANSLAGMAQLGASTAFIGIVRDDQLGKIFRHDMESIGIDFVTEPRTSGKSTASCLILVTPDGERTMNTYIGACADITPDDVKEEVIQQANYVFIEGYLWDQEPAKEAIRKVLDMGGDAKLAFSLSDVFCVDRHREDFRDLVRNKLDILFANEAELLSLYETDDFEAATKQLAQEVEIAFVTRGEQGSLVITAEQTYRIPPSPVSKLVDTTGAGDLYAAGALYGLSRGWELDRCGRLGSHCASDIIQQMGARALQPLDRHLAA